MSAPARSHSAAPAWLVWAALWVVYLVWGSTYLAIRITVETLPPLLAAGVRFVVAGAVMYAFLALKRGAAGVRVTRDEIKGAALIGGLLVLGGNGLVMVAEQEVPSGLAALIIASTPLWIVLFRFLTRDTVPRGTLVGVGIGFVGVAMLVLPGNGSEGASVLAMLLVVAAAVFWAGGSFISTSVSLPSDPLTSTAVQMVLGGGIALVAGIVTGEPGRIDVSSFSAASVWALVYLVTAGSLLAFTAYTWLLQNAPITKVSTYAYVNPVIAVFLGWLILSEAITPLILTAAVVIVASVAFIVRKEAPPDPQEEAEVAPPPGSLGLRPERIPSGSGVAATVSRWIRR